jgi:hypothetical protein
MKRWYSIQFVIVCVLSMIYGPILVSVLVTSSILCLVMLILKGDGKI